MPHDIPPLFSPASFYTRAPQPSLNAGGSSSLPVTSPLENPSGAINNPARGDVMGLRGGGHHKTRRVREKVGNNRRQKASGSGSETGSSIWDSYEEAYSSDDSSSTSNSSRYHNGHRVDPFTTTLNSQSPSQNSGVQPQVHNPVHKPAYNSTTGGMPASSQSDAARRNALAAKLGINPLPTVSPPEQVKQELKANLDFVGGAINSVYHQTVPGLQPELNALYGELNTLHELLSRTLANPEEQKDVRDYFNLTITSIHSKLAEINKRNESLYMNQQSLRIQQEAMQAKIFDMETANVTSSTKSIANSLRDIHSIHV